MSAHRYHASAACARDGASLGRETKVSRSTYTWREAPVKQGEVRLRFRSPASDKCPRPRRLRRRPFHLGKMEWHEYFDIFRLRRERYSCIVMRRRLHGERT